MLKPRVFISQYGEVFVPGIEDTVAKKSYKHIGVSYNNSSDAKSHAENSINTHESLKRYKEIKTLMEKKDV